MSIVRFATRRPLLVPRPVAAAWRPLLVTVMVAAPWIRPASAQSDSFFRVAPGPLGTVHQKWDNSDGCTKCHKLGGGVTDFLCLNCHTHANLKKAIAEKHGLHTTFTRPCIKCHHEHKGRQGAIVDWSPLGGRRNFAHTKTGFNLTNLHAKAPCTSCHKRKLISGRTSYTGLKADCDGCHRNPHGFTNTSLRQNCKQCHAPGVARKMRGADVPFKHAKVTGISLGGKHRAAQCVACHKRGKMALRGKPRTCVDCHRNPHGVIHRKKLCTDCHTPERNWKLTTFKHDPKRFPTQGKHETAKCNKCHKSAKQKPPRECAVCHQDPHRKRFEKQRCEFCHGIGGTKTIDFDHDNKTKFRLTGKHGRGGCRSCHRGRGPREFEQFPTPNCMDCHRHRNAHKGQFKGTECSKCHAEGGSKKLRFNHQEDARFKLTGFHLELEKKKKCQKCHPRAKYRTGKLECVQCHKDSHNKELGDKCGRCHTTNVKFKKIAFDHDRLSRFKRVGRHAKVECKKCHPDRRYKTGKIKCIDCHAKDDKHKKRLGTDCGKCHTPEKNMTNFVHATMTKFARDGAHEKVACAFCHRTPPLGKPLPEVGWTKSLPVPKKKDLLFPLSGRTCAECHRDKHAGQYGLVCDSCHNTTSFKDVSRAVHDSGATRLQGTHDRVPCWRCHDDETLLAGIGDLCQLCHWEDDTHRNGLGPLCGDCHGQVDWSPARFNHVQVGYLLRGSHRLARCDGCHGLGTYQGTPQNCDFCHTVDAARVVDPLHAAEFGECQNCHNESAFVPVRHYHPTYPLRGLHAVLSCSVCHGGGTYAGTPTECFGCHESRFWDPANSPNHTAAGFSTRCEDCHSPIGWQPARYQHQRFIRRGVHRVTACTNCHPGEDYSGAFGGTVAMWDCVLCHGAGAPADPGGGWVQDHSQKGYPNTCDVCHTEVAWKPAKTPP